MYNSKISFTVFNRDDTFLGHANLSLKEIDLHTLHNRQPWELSLSASEDHDNSWKVVSSVIEIEGDLLVQVFMGQHQDLLRLKAKHVSPTTRAVQPVG